MTHSDSHLLRLRILTTELWEIIFHQLSSTHDLRRLATVCATFNALCIRIFQVPPQIQGLSFRVLPFWRPRNSPRSCACTPSGVVDNKPKSITADLSVLRNFVLPSERLREPRLSFGDDLFSPPVAPSSESPLDAFCALLSAMAGAPSPAIVVSFNKISSCRREDTDQVQSHPEVPLRAPWELAATATRQGRADLSTSSKFKLESSASFTSPAALAVAPTLSCVHSVAVWLDCDPACACAAGEVLSRLALLPPVAEVRFAMRAAEFSCSDGSADPRVHTPEVDAFAERAWAALPGVGNGSARSVCPEWG
ncbi:hypothetical protein C8R43DRAFT_1140406 [Mycena crocata]|nr:hypothetical protein C8R43DRAFT_1140406 [Mycena crocata]